MPPIFWSEQVQQDISLWASQGGMKTKLPRPSRLSIHERVVPLLLTISLYQKGLNLVTSWKWQLLDTFHIIIWVTILNILIDVINLQIIFRGHKSRFLYFYNLLVNFSESNSWWIGSLDFIALITKDYNCFICEGLLTKVFQRILFCLHQYNYFHNSSPMHLDEWSSHSASILMIFW